MLQQQQRPYLLYAEEHAATPAAATPAAAAAASQEQQQQAHLVPAGGVTFEPYVKFLKLLSSRWSSYAAAQHLTVPVAEYLVPRFSRCSKALRVRILTSFIYIFDDEKRLGMQNSLLQIIKTAEVDSDDWVRKLGRMVGSFVLNGALDVREADTETAFQILKFLDDQKKYHNLQYLPKPPLETCYVVHPLEEREVNDTPTTQCANGNSNINCSSAGGNLKAAPAATTRENASFHTHTTKKKLEPGSPPGTRGCVSVLDTVNFVPSVDFIALTVEFVQQGEQQMKAAYSAVTRRASASSSSSASLTAIINASAVNYNNKNAHHARAT